MTPVRPTTSPRRRHSRGITTAEVLVASVVSMIVVLAVMGFFDAQQKAFATLNAYSQSQEITRTAIDVIARDIRMSSYDPLDTAIPESPGAGACPDVTEGLVTARPNTIRIQQDLDGNGAIVGPGEDVMYFLTGDEIRRVDVANGATVATLVTGVAPTGFQVRYFDNQTPPNEIVPAGSPPSLTQAQRACVEKVQVRIQAQIDSPVANRNDLVSTVESGVAIRNRSLTKF